MFEGEKTTIFWIGLIVFGYSIYLFCQVIWQVIFTFSDFPVEIGVVAVPAIIGGTIFLIIGLKIMKTGVKKETISKPELKQTP
jgi:ABC-type enterochelin transport system permease subunit